MTCLMRQIDSTQRLLKEAVYELGHPLELTHGDNYGCVIAASHAIEWVDLREPMFCAGCQN